MSDIFISYRREDSADVTGRINDHFFGEFSEEKVFTDVDDIPLGVDFRQHIDQEVSHCSVFIAVIGHNWLNAGNEQGQRRLDNPADFVRIEIESAINREIPVIPVLVGHASMPAEHQLPDSIKQLAFRHAASVRPDPDFRTDIQRLIRGINRHISGIDTPGKDGSIIQDKLAIGGLGPEMVIIPQGSFLMGSPESEAERTEAEGPQHKVTVQSYALGKYQVTFEEYDRFVDATGRESPGDKAWGRGKQPVINVSWEDANAYAEWLIEQTGQNYRLPSEAE